MTPKEEKVVQEAQTDFIEALYPYYRKQEQQQKDRQVDVLHRWVAGGPVGITPQVEMQGRAKSRELLARGAEAKKAKQAERDEGRLVRLSSKAWRERAGARKTRVHRVRRRK